MQDAGYRYIVVTLSENGIFAMENSGEYVFYPAEKRSIADVSGAGDTVISTLTLSLLAGAGVFDAAYLANIAGGLVCEKVGVVPVDKTELYDEIISRL